MRMIDRLSRRALPDPESLAVYETTWGNSLAERVTHTYAAYASGALLSNATVFALIQARIGLFSQAEFKYQNRANARLYGTEALSILENPWPNGTAADLLALMELHNSLGGNAFVRRIGDRLVCLRPDWVDIVRAEVTFADGREFDEVMGYLYRDEGYGDGTFIPVEEVAHWYPMPDPLSPGKGMSWITPVAREVNADAAMTKHVRTFFENAATPNLMIKYQQKLTQEAFESIKARWAARYGGPSNSGGTVVLDNGADLSVVGSTFESMRFDSLRSAGETRIAQAAGVPPVVGGLQSGLDASTYSNYAQAMRLFAFQTETRWQSVVATLAKFVDVPTDSRLWYSTQNISAMQDAETERATAAHVYAQAANVLITAGYEPGSVQSALTAGDMSLLRHTGMVSVQLQSPGQTPPPAAGGIPA